MFGGEPDTPHETPGEEFAKGHYEQLIAATGTIKVGEREWDINGFGLRDHSWGPRYWQAPWYYRWLTANVDENFGFMASRVAKKDGPGSRGGFVWENGTMHLCDDVRDHHRDAWRRPVPRPRSRGSCVRAAPTASGSSAAEALSLIPLRNRRQAPDGEWLQTRISEAYTEWTVRSGEFEGTSRLRHVGVPRPDHRRSTGGPRRVTVGLAE